MTFKIYGYSDACKDQVPYWLLERNNTGGDHCIISNCFNHYQCCSWMEITRLFLCAKPMVISFAMAAFSGQIEPLIIRHSTKGGPYVDSLPDSALQSYWSLWTEMFWIENSWASPEWESDKQGLLQPCFMLEWKRMSKKDWFMFL